MCDIWKDNHNLKQLTAADISGLLSALKQLGTKQVLMSGGEALLNPNFFSFCELLKKQQLKITLLSTGLALKKNASQITTRVDDIIVSLDGDEALHNSIRNIPDAFAKMADGITAIREIDPAFKITGRTVIHQQNYKQWPLIIDAAKELGLNQISFLPADVSSHAFNREVLWDENRKNEVLIREAELTQLNVIIDELITVYRNDFENGFIAESPDKIRKIAQYYASFYNLAVPPYKKCNAPWVSAVVEADGTVRHCFFHKAYGNIKKDALENLINNTEAVNFRKQLDTAQDPTCVKCVCYLNLKPGTKL
jgi:MoaA/NifB/PqqE/SkfB family radical SAM enzyme